MPPSAGGAGEADPVDAGPLDALTPPCGEAGCSAPPPANRRCKISNAEIGSTAVSYLPFSGLFAITVLRSSGVIVPIRADGGRTIARSTMLGVPPPSRNDTSASPLASSMMTCAVLSLGLGRNVSAQSQAQYRARHHGAR